MPTHNKSGYEIRLEILQMAMGIADNRWHEANNLLRYQAERTNASTYTIAKDTRVQDATQIAEELYAFVDQK